MVLRVQLEKCKHVKSFVPLVGWLVPDPCFSVCPLPPPPFPSPLPHTQSAGLTHDAICMQLHIACTDTITVPCAVSSAHLWLALSECVAYSACIPQQFSGVFAWTIKRLSRDVLLCYMLLMIRIHMTHYINHAKKASPCGIRVDEAQKQLSNQLRNISVTQKLKKTNLVDVCTGGIPNSHLNNCILLIH